MPEPAQRALPLLERAISLEPDYAAAQAAMAQCLHARYQRAGLLEADRQAALHHARLAIATGADDATALAASGFVLGSEAQDYEAAFDALDRALGLSPSSFLALSYSCIIRGWGGDYATSIAHGQQAIRLSPFDTALHLPYIGLAHAHYFAGDFDKAALAAGRCAQANPQFSPPWVIRTAALAMLGRDEEARTSAQRLLELWSGFAIGALMAIDYTSIEHREMLAQGLRRAGVPE